MYNEYFKSVLTIRQRTVPRVGLNPMILLNAAGMRPEPAVSVASENETCLLATLTQEPELEPPEM